MINYIFFKLPVGLQNTIISLYNSILYKTRYGGNYKKYKKEIKSNNNLSLQELRTKQENLAINLLRYSLNNSKFYKAFYSNINTDEIKTIDDLKKLPILTKENLRKNIADVYTISKNEGVISKTGGTTGKPLEVVYTKNDIQKRFAFLDNFREQFGYKLGEKTAWFSGKKLLSDNDVKKNRFWKYDYINKVRYYSTFHINDKYLEFYLKDLIKFEPKYFVGFPSTMLELAKFGIRNKIEYPENSLIAVFPTAETVTAKTKKTIESYFKTALYDQYASSEGAPFIFECVNKKLHLELQSGVFEILDNNGSPSKEGSLVLTSFTTHGTPLIRYNIGDDLKLAKDNKCNCGNNNPTIEAILGRQNDYVFSPTIGKINLGNVSNTLKGVNGIKKFQVVQNEINKIEIIIVIDSSQFNEKNKTIFLNNWRDRVGNQMKIDLNIVDSIPSEKSGKYRIVKNNIKKELKN